MLRVISAAVRGIVSHVNVNNVGTLVFKEYPKLITNVTQIRGFSLLSTQSWLNRDRINDKSLIGAVTPYGNILSSVQDTTITPKRTVIKFSARKGKRKTVKTVVKRFYRLNWGIWIRRYCAHNKHMWRKTEGRKRRLRQHIFTNSTQSWLLDTMVTKYWRRPSFYVDDPYNPYHQREEFAYTRRKPFD
ncbi:PREDICTED: 39S ribosomal protein L35, mitochondrial [Polistes dominula]|uniref:Large ribosomal subunit protein bL35m n=1 Tax=Polistes dominula TaxID=743375 RepID=A0ABM1J1P4_POLDO|nr:PREDICTED: 39S ribosomal protein L35, mitochondrial [Polistes dominula]